MKRTLPLLAAIAAYFIGVLIWVGNDRRIAHDTFDAYSALNTGSDGLSLASRYLRATMLTRPVAPERVAQKGVVFRVVESVIPSVVEESGGEDGKPEQPDPSTSLGMTEDEYAWLRRGGRMVLAIGGTYGALDTRGTTAKRATKVFPIWSGIDAIELPEGRTLAGDVVLHNAHTLFALDGKPAVSRIRIGDGELILLAAPELFTNEHVAKNLALLVALAGGRPAYFDEVVHGLRSDAGVLELLKEWRLGPFLLLVLVVLATLFWRRGRAVGPPENEFRDRRSEAVDLVASLGALYDRSMSNDEAIARYHHELTRAVAANTGLRGDPLHKRVADLAGDVHRPVDEAEFRDLLHRLNESFRRLEHAEHR